MPNIFKSYHKDKRGIVRPTRKQIPVAGRVGVARTADKGDRLQRLKLKNKPMSKLLGLEESTIVRICIQRKLGGIGDVIMTTPIAKAFKELYPGCEFTYATEPGVLSTILSGNPYIDKVVDFKTVNPADYHLFADVTSTGLSYEKATNPPKNRIDMFAEYVGLRLSDYKPTYVVSAQEATWAKTVLGKWFGTRDTYKLIYLDISSVDRRRSWPVEHALKMLTDIVAVRKDIRFVVNDFNRRLGREWNYQNCTDVSQYGIRESSAILNECDLFIGPDSGMLHIAGALEKSIIGIFGSTPSAARINHYKNATAVETQIKCRFCWYKNCTIDYQCFKDIQPQEVRDAALTKLGYQTKVQQPIKGISLMTPGGSDFEIDQIIQHIANGMTKANIVAKVKSTKTQQSDVIFDVIKTSKIKKATYQPSPNGVLKVGYVIVDSKTFSRDAISRIAGTYDLLLTTDTESVKTLTRAGVSQPIYSIPIPIYRLLPTSKHDSKVNRIAAIVTDSKSKQLKDLVESFTELKKTMPDLLLDVLLVDGDLDVTAVLPGVTYHTASMEQVQYFQFWDKAHMLVDLTELGSDVFLKEAMMRGVICLGTTKNISSDLFYSVDSADLTKSLTDAVTDVFDSYVEQIALTPSARNWVIENSSQSQLQMMITFIGQKLNNK